MNKVKILSIAFIAATAVVQAQDIETTKKVIDAEQYEKAKSMLKSIIQSKPADGKASFLLGNIYLKQGIEDSAKMAFQRGLSAANEARFNNIGLAEIDLDNGNIAAAQAKFDLVNKEIKKKQVEEYVYMARAFMNISKPNYKSALEILNKAKVISPNDAQVQLALGDAYFGDKNQNDAYASYRNAFQNDPTLLRAKMQLGVLLKFAKAYNEAVKGINEVLSLNSNYGPAYRELAETHYLWGSNQPKTYKENIQKALDYYEKYLSLTDYSLSSRMRHADFLILAKDYKALELEANEMKKLDNVNPRILRYLGYSAYENGNPSAAITALTDYISTGTNKIIAGDYYYLGLAQTNKSLGEDGKVTDAVLLKSGIDNLKKSLEMDIVMANGLNDIGKKYFTLKSYEVASHIFELAITNPESRNFLEDNVYYGLSVYTENRGKDAANIDAARLNKADIAMDNVITASPNYQEAYLYKARINSSLEKDDVMAATFQKYVDMVVAKGDEEIGKNKSKVTEAYNSIAAYFANTDKTKAIEYFNKTLALDPTNSYATTSLQALKKK
jgi:cytochrome c-type biogenesis protein CcmH/NrfG